MVAEHYGAEEARVWHHARPGESEFDEAVGDITGDWLNVIRDMERNGMMNAESVAKLVATAVVRQATHDWDAASRMVADAIDAFSDEDQPSDTLDEAVVQANAKG